MIVSIEFSHWSHALFTHQFSHTVEDMERHFLNLEATPPHEPYDNHAIAAAQSPNNVNALDAVRIPAISVDSIEPPGP